MSGYILKKIAALLIPNAPAGKVIQFVSPSGVLMQKDEAGTVSPVASADPVMGPSGPGHAAGLAPDPGATPGQLRFLREDSTWAVPPGSAPGGDGVPAGATMRNVMTRGIPNIHKANETYGSGRSIHINHGGDLKEIVLTVENTRYDDQGEYEAAAGRQIRRSIEYPLNLNPPSVTQVTWGGLATHTFVAGDYRPDSDEITLVVPIPDGAEFGIRNWDHAPDGVLISDGNMSCDGESFSLSTDPLDDMTMTGVITDWGNNADKNCYPIHMKAMSNRPSVLILHDSRGTGVNDQSNSFGSLGGRGEIARSLDYGVAYTLCATGADNVHQFLQHSTMRRALQEAHTHVCIGLGCGDLVDIARTGEQIFADMQTLWAMFPGKRVSQTTPTASAQSTDNFMTEENQTTDPSEPQRQILLARLRNMQMQPNSLIHRLLDIALVMDSKTKPGVYRAPGTAPAGLLEQSITSDAYHYSPYGYGLVQKSGVAAPEKFN